MAEETKSGEVKTPFADSVVKKHEPTPSGKARTGSEEGFPERTGGKLPEVNRYNP